MDQIYVQFSDESEQAIVAAFCVAQNPKDYPNQGGVDMADVRWKTFYDAQSESAQRGWPSPTE